MSSVKSLIIVDMLNDFVEGKLSSGREMSIVKNIKKMLSLFRKSNLPVIYSNDSHIPDDYEFKIWGEHALHGTQGAEVYKDIAPVEGDYIVPKRKYSAFTGTDLLFLLKEKNVDTVVLCGVHTHICIRHTGYDAFVNNYNIEVIEDCVNSSTQEEHVCGLKYLKTVYGANVINSDDFSI